MLPIYFGSYNNLMGIKYFESVVQNGVFNFF